MTARKRPKKSDRIISLPSVRYWQEQLNGSGIRHDIKITASTRDIYLHKLSMFNEWLAGREFDVRVPAVAGGRIVHESVRKSFASVEGLLRFGEDGNGNEKGVKRIINRYMADPRHGNLKRSTMSGTCAAIKSYFDTNDVMTGVRFNGRKNDAFEVTEEPELTLAEFYKMMTISKIDPMVRAVMLVKFQAGLDSSTLADRFNFYAYQQIAKYCGTADHGAWDLGRCPIPIELIRVKTAVRFTTFIDRDALSAIRDYLAWRERTHGPHDPKGAMFITTRDRPIDGEWVSEAFGRLAEYSGTQRRLAPRVLKIRSHNVRRLLKSTLTACGCAAWAADHVLGHAPKDPYEGTPGLFPKELRREYAKASHVINMFSKAVSKINDTDPSDAIEKALEASEARNEELMRKLNEAHGLLAKKDARRTNQETKIEMVIKAILDASGDPDGDFRQNLKARLDGLL